MVANNPEIITAQPTIATSSGSLSYYDAANKKMYLFNDNSTVKLTVFSLGGCKVVNAPSWMTVIPGTKQIIQWRLHLNRLLVLVPKIFLQQ